jgi:cytochrome c551/c552
MKKHHLLTALMILGTASVLSAAEPQATWDEHCAKCHGADGKGETKMGKKLSIHDFTDAKTQAEFTDEQAFDAMKKGITDKNGKTTMKPIEDVSDADLKAMIPFVRAFKK